MRKRSTLLNSVAGLLNRLVSVAFVFIVRRFFMNSLDVEYLGYEGLFLNILGIFSLVDLGLGTAIAFDLYEPIYNNDREQVSSIMHLFKTFYVATGILIFFLSLCFTPFLLNFIKDYTINGRDIQLYFLIYAFGVSLSYFFSYKRTLVFALQKNRVVLNIDSAAKIIQSLVQIWLLVRYQNYALYLSTIAITNVLSNVAVSIVCDKGDYYDKKDVKPLSSEYKKKLKDHVKTLAITNIAWQGLASTDNIIISSLVGALELAKNANYSSIFNNISGIVSSMLGSVSASIGDLLAEKDEVKIKNYFDRYCFIYWLTASYAMLGIMFVSDDVISVWLNESLLFNKATVFLVSFNLYLSLVFKPVVDYQNYSGCFVYYKPYSIIVLVINIVSSTVLAKMIGISGVFLGTALSYSFMITVVVKIVYRYVFKENPNDYLKQMVRCNIPLLVSFIVLFALSSFLRYDYSLLSIVLKIILVTIVYGSCVLVFLRNDDCFHFFLELIKSIVLRKKDL